VRQLTQDGITSNRKHGSGRKIIKGKKKENEQKRNKKRLKDKLVDL
jgi:hypothetical protein